MGLNMALKGRSPNRDDGTADSRLSGSFVTVLSPSDGERSRRVVVAGDRLAHQDRAIDRIALARLEGRAPGATVAEKPPAVRIEHLEDLVALVERTVHPVGIVVGPRPVRHPRLVEQPAQVLPRLGLVAALELHELQAADLDKIGGGQTPNVAALRGLALLPARGRHSPLAGVLISPSPGV